MTNIQKETLENIFSKYSGNQDELIPIMEEVQNSFGFLSSKSMTEIAYFLSIPESKVYGVATFYALFKLKPSGKKVVRVCRGTACHVRGGARILNEVEQSLGIKPGEATKDMEYGLETVACIGACALAPCLTVGTDVHGQMTPKKVSEVFGDNGRSKQSE